MPLRVSPSLSASTWMASSTTGNPPTHTHSAQLSHTHTHTHTHTHSHQSNRESCQREGEVEEEGSLMSGGHEEVDGIVMYHGTHSLEQSEERGLKYWPGNVGDTLAYDSSQEPVFHLPPPLIPSSPFTLSPSPPLSPTFPVLPEVHTNSSGTHLPPLSTDMYVTTHIHVYTHLNS